MQRADNIIEYDMAGYPVPRRGVSFTKDGWQRFVRNLERVMNKFRSPRRAITYRRIIDERLVELPAVVYRQGRSSGWCRLGPSNIESAVMMIKKRKQIPFTNRIATELGICSRTLRRKAQEYRIELPHREKWRSRTFEGGESDEKKQKPAMIVVNSTPGQKERAYAHSGLGIYVNRRFRY